MPRILPTLLVLFLASLSTACNAPPTAKDPLATIATGILSAWHKADLVCLGETHGSLADAALRTALLNHPQFLTTVDVIVLESASGIHQQLIDRFIVGGEKLTREDLQPIWRDAGRGVFWELPLYEEFLRTVRRINLTVPRSQRVRVLGGAVAIPWQQVVTAEDLLPWTDRETLLHRLLQEEVFDKQLKALAIYGSFHCEKEGASAAAALHLEKPGRVFSVFAFSDAQGAHEGRTRLGLGPEPALVPVTGTKHAGKKVGASFFKGHTYSGARFGDLLDAVIFYGSIPNEVLNADEDALDPIFRREVARRDRLWREAAR